jgi:hypothetical protein
MFTLISGHYDDAGTPVIFLKKGQPFPSLGYPNHECPHPHIYSIYAEWESDSLGHGWFCALCGALNEVG